MIKKNRLKVLVLAAGGSGMNVIAQHFLKHESIVYGMDRDFDKGLKIRIKNNLQSLGLILLKETESIKDLQLDLIISSPAIEKSHQVLQTAIEKNILVKNRTEFLSSLFNESFGIGVSGTSGKTTITGMVATILNSPHDLYSVFCGDEIINYSTPKRLGNYIRGRENKMIIELDESDKSLPLFKSMISCISSIQKDHMSIPDLQELFDNFANNTQKLILNIDSGNIDIIHEKYIDKIKTVSAINPSANYYVKLEKFNDDSLTYSINGTIGTLSISGKYNILNAGMAVAIACETGISITDAMTKLKNFKGIKNRFEVKKRNNSYFILDFAHNPEKIKFSLMSAQEINLPVVYIFQPHGYGPLKFMLNEFADSFNSQLRPIDTVIILKIYDSGGSADRTIHSNDLLNLIETKNKFYMEKHVDVIDYFKTQKSNALTWVVTGARDELLRNLNAALVHESKI